jgi:hypothetical protein
MGSFVLHHHHDMDGSLDPSNLLSSDICDSLPGGRAPEETLGELHEHG